MIDDKRESERGCTALKSFKVLTYNVWFDHVEFIPRMKSIIDATVSLRPDVCCFQEVLPEFADMLQNDSEIGKVYVVSPPPTSGYGTMTLARRDLSPSFESVEFPSVMGRSLLTTTFSIKGADIAIGNVHLESLSNERTRREQLVICEKSLKKYSSAILVGDFNFCSEKNFHPTPSAPLENDVLQNVLPSYVDVWPFLQHVRNPRGGGKIGYTFDSEVNKMIAKQERMRYDRVLARCELIVPSDIVLVGEGALAAEEVGLAADEVSKVWPSDHFGLLATFHVHEVSGTADTIVTDSSSSSISISNSGSGSGIRTGETMHSPDDFEDAPPIPPPYMHETKSVAAPPTIPPNYIPANLSVGDSGTAMNTNLFSRVHLAMLRAVNQTRLPVRLLAIDFDATLCQVHTYGRWRGSVEALVAHIRPVFVAILTAGMQFSPSVLRIAIVTFSGQKKLIRQVLESVVGVSAASNIFLRTARRDWTVPDSYIPHATRTGKQPHIASVLEEIFRDTEELIEAEQVVLIDDDEKNIACAKACSKKHKTVLFPPLPLPGVHMKSIAMEATGVKVLQRCQLRHGAILCISQGSVVDFTAPAAGEASRAQQSGQSSAVRQPSAIVNAANSYGLGGGGVDGAIARAGGAKLFAARKAIPQDGRGHRIPPGECRVTGPGDFGDLRVTHVLHAVGPDYREIRKSDGQGESDLQRGDTLLASAYCNAMCRAREQRIELLGFSLISAGVFRGPQSLRAVLSIAVDCVSREAYEGLREVHLVGYSAEEVSMLVDIVSSSPPASVLRGAGGEAEIEWFLDQFEKNSLS